MSNLVLKLRQGERMLVNGAHMRFRTNSQFELTEKARFLFGKQVMTRDEVDGPVRQIYFALQAAYVGAEGERSAGLILARDLAKSLATPDAWVEQAMALAESDDYNKALRMLRYALARASEVVA